MWRDSRSRARTARSWRSPRASRALRTRGRAPCVTRPRARWRRLRLRRSARGDRPRDGRWRPSADPLDAIDPRLIVRQMAGVALDERVCLVRVLLAHCRREGVTLVDSELLAAHVAHEPGDMIDDADSHP